MESGAGQSGRDVGKGKNVYGNQERKRAKLKMRRLYMGRKMKQRLALVVTAALLAGMLPAGNKSFSKAADVSAMAGEQVIYDAAEFASFQGRTKEEVGRRYGEAMYAGESYIDGDSSTYYETAYSLENPYAAGKLTQDTHKTMTAMTEFYRWLVGVKPLQAASEHSDKLQAEALVRNFEFNHTISDSSKPEDMAQEFWDYGAKDYIHTILARYSTPQNAITSWMNEGYSHSYGIWDTVGHRYALIGATVSDVQFGYAGSIAIGQEKEYDNTMENPFSAFPAPGYMPNDLVRSSSSAWSIQMNRSRIAVADGSSVVVKVTNMDTGESYECTRENGKLQAYSSQLVFVQPVPVSGKRYEGSYRVDVTGLTDIETGGDAVITYTTEFFDSTEYTPSYVKTITADGIEKYILYTSTATTENLEKIAYALPDEVTVVAENGRTAQVPVTGNWILNEEEQCWVNEADETKLPSDIMDRENVLKKCAIYYEVSESVYDSYNSMTISPREGKEGEGAQMRVFLSLISADTSAIFQLVPQGDGTYIGRKRYDSRTSEEFEVTSNGDHMYTIPSLQKNDEGEYFSIFYESSGTCAYVSTQIQTLTVQDEPQPTPESTPGASAAPESTFGGAGTPSPGPSATPGATSGGASTPSPGPSATPESTPGGNSGGQSGNVGGGNTGESGTDINDEGNTKTGDDKESTIPKVAKVKKFKAKAQKKGLVLTWEKNAKVSGYQIQISTKRNFKGAKKASIKKSKSEYKIASLKPGKKYYVRICAYQSYEMQDGKKKRVYGGWTVKRIRTLK